jgi:hypothetical protein
MAMEFADEVSIVGPKQILTASGYFRVVQNSDTPHPLDIGVV